MSNTFDGSAQPHAPVLTVSNVAKSFGSTQAVDGISFEAHRGQVLALLGPNGAGKTTTIEMCEGFQKPSSGSISVLGFDPATQGEKVRESIGIMLQGGGGYSGLTVREMLKLSASYNVDPHDPEWLISLLGLEGVAGTTYRRLSGGQQQRLSLALAIIGRPELVFLDEPTAGMDAQSRLRVWDIIDGMRNDGTTVILTTHLMDEAESLADHVVIIDHGKVIAEGSPDTLTQRDTKSSLRFTTATPLDIDAALANGITLLQQRALHYSLDDEPTPEVVARIAEEAARQGVLITELGVSHCSLEEVFLELTGREMRS